ncbi:MAG: DUF2752 domain-containing protein [Deltaproteobacteria bacterium]|nr:MAG: DUF2752 domain-containing protein [Deltaproteobacteria bacterium]
MRERLISAALLVPALVALGIARWLEPAVQGHGTHTQLGLNSCSILSWTGYPCPMCGMTTAFSLLAHFRPIQALLVQPFGAVLFLLTVAVAAIALVELVWPTGRWQRLWSLVRPYEGWLTLAFLLGLALGWIYKIWQML